MTTPDQPGFDDDIESLSFEDAFRRLGETADRLETGGLPLAEAVAVYEQGMALMQYCNRLLSETEIRITQLQEAYSRPGPGPDLDWDEEPDE